MENEALVCSGDSIPRTPEISKLDTTRNEGSAEDEDDEDYEADQDRFGSFLDLLEDGIDSEDKCDAKVDINTSTVVVAAADDDDLSSVVARLRQRADTSTTTDDQVAKVYKEKIHLVQANMGSMTQCRGKRGDLLGEAGAVDALLRMLLEAVDRMPGPTEDIADDENLARATVELVIACLGAVRDLACGLALNRSAVRTFHVDETSGLGLLASYLQLYHGTTWAAISRPLHLRLLTNVIGTMRNVTHSTPENCSGLHECGVSDMLIWRLLHGERGASIMPDISCPWREASFRASGTLINMAEKCPECATLCGRNVSLIHYLVDAWGGSIKSNLVHVGLLAVLRAAQCELSDDMYDECWDKILQNEKERKQYAQRAENERKARVQKRVDRGDPVIL